MSLLFDQNLSRRLPGLLADAFPGSEHVSSTGLASAADRAVWDHAGTHGLAVVSKDLDFLYLSARVGSPPKLVLLRVGNGPTREIEGLLRSRTPDIQAFLGDPAASILELP